MIATNVRHTRDFQGDLAAMIGSARVGERRLLALLGEYGPALTLAGMEEVLDAAERQTRSTIAEWKDGVYRGEAILDDDGHGYRDIYVRAKVTKRGSDLTVDPTQSHPQVTGFINSSYANMRSAVAMALS
jgi:N-methylhydantoinase B